MQSITVQTATPESGRVLYSALSAFYPEWETDDAGNCFVSIQFSSERQFSQVFDAIQQHLADRGEPPVTTVTFSTDDGGRLFPRDFLGDGL